MSIYPNAPSCLPLLFAFSPTTPALPLSPSLHLPPLVALGRNPATRCSTRVIITAPSRSRCSWRRGIPCSIHPFALCLPLACAPTDPDALLFGNVQALQSFLAVCLACFRVARPALRNLDQARLGAEAERGAKAEMEKAGSESSGLFARKSECACARAKT